MTPVQRSALEWVRDHEDTFYHVPARGGVDYPRSDVLSRLRRAGLIVPQANAKHCISGERSQWYFGWNLTDAGREALR
jgi:hypothetical protein